MLLRSAPTPVSATISPASATEAPTWRAVRAMMGKTAPSTMPNRNDGPKAGMAIFLRLKLFGAVTMGQKVQQKLRKPDSLALSGDSCLYQ